MSGHEVHIWRIAYLPGGERVVTCLYDKTVRIVWDVEKGEREGTSMVHEDELHGLAVTRDGKRILSGNTGRIVCIALSPDDQLTASGGDDGKIEIREIKESGGIEHSIDTGHMDYSTQTNRTRGQGASTGSAARSPPPYYEAVPSDDYSSMPVSRKEKHWKEFLLGVTVVMFFVLISMTVIVDLISAPRQPCNDSLPFPLFPNEFIVGNLFYFPSSFALLFPRLVSFAFLVPILNEFMGGLFSVPRCFLFLVVARQLVVLAQFAIPLLPYTIPEIPVKRKMEREQREEDERRRLNMFWVDVEPYGCATYATRQYTARLANVPSKYNRRVEACKATPLVVHDQSYLPSTCEDNGSNGIIGTGLRHVTPLNYRAAPRWVLEGDATTPVRFHGMQFSGAEESFQSTWGVYGLWEIDDDEC
ncbi:hypothetical protein PAXINDRAFT_17704 [Paxillus involutus ATCC 200175]|uniref:Uncharacterized protein n=1 Tax=Paxillus involutus ATCC 200175 TaxID=664439 RepID=A0A0C9TPY4_PAXIN|nr:hypothetical protein PAXINDRAFT_17704 [Paxillus involutus ATCC 200175]